jgi:hypothetical protein
MDVDSTVQVLITGARTATLLQRLPFLPSADAYVAENGGRIFYPDQTLPTAMPLMEDTKWRKSHTTGAHLRLDLQRLSPASIMRVLPMHV